MDVVEKIWIESIAARDNLNVIQNKLNKISRYLKGWGRNFRGQTLKNSKDLTDEVKELEALEEIQPLISDQMARRSFIQNSIHQPLEEEEEYWHKRSREDWLLKGDNTLHELSIGRRRKKHIYYLNM